MERKDIGDKQVCSFPGGREFVQGNKMNHFKKQSRMVSTVGKPLEGGRPVTKSREMWD